MSDLKITVEQIKNYIGTGLEIRVVRKPSFLSDPDQVSIEEFRVEDFNVLFRKRYGVKEAKPIFYRLSDLDKEIEHNGERFIPELQMMEIWSRYHKDSIKSMYQLQVHETELYRVYHDLKKLFEWHFWPFGDEYFEQGLVIDKRKIL